MGKRRSASLAISAKLSADAGTKWGRKLLKILLSNNRSMADYTIEDRDSLVATIKAEYPQLPDWYAETAVDWYLKAKETITEELDGDAREEALIQSLKVAVSLPKESCDANVVVEEDETCE
jgi:hypothetical protein